MILMFMRGLCLVGVVKYLNITGILFLKADCFILIIFISAFIAGI